MQEINFSSRVGVFLCSLGGLELIVLLPQTLCAGITGASHHFHLYSIEIKMFELLVLLLFLKP